MQIFSGRKERVELLAFSPCGRWLAAGKRRLHMWDTSKPTAKPRRSADFWYIHNLAFRPDGRILIRDAGDDYYLINPEDFEAESVGTLDNNVVISNDGSQLIRIVRSSAVSSWKLGPKEQLVRGAQRSVRGHFVRDAVFSHDGTTLATFEWGKESQLVFRAAQTLKKLRTATIPYFTATQLLFSPDGTKLFLCSAASLVCYDVNNPEEKPRKVVNPSRKHFVAMAVHPEGKLLTVDNDALVRIWDIATLTQVRTIEWKIGGLYAVTVSPDGTRAATGGSRGKVLVWDWD